MVSHILHHLYCIYLEGLKIDDFVIELNIKQDASLLWLHTTLNVEM